LKELHNDKGLSAAVYTQLTDVMTEVNGLLTYDRVPKIDVAKIAEANHFNLAMPTYSVVVPTSEQTSQTWKYTTEKASEDWAMPAYNDSQWAEGKGGFGNSGTNGAAAWKTSDIWLRRTFNPGALTADQIANLVVRDLHLGYVEVLINGVRAYSQQGQSHSWEYRGVASDARASVKPNSENVLAVHCTRRGDDQFIDAGLDVRVISER